MEITWHTGDDWSLYARVIGSPSGGGEPPLVLLHGGGPDHEMFIPLARHLRDLCRVVLPDIRGYGRSVCTDPALHTWSRYAGDVVALLDHLSLPRAVIGGAGLGGTIALRTALAFPERVEALIAISVEEIEDDEAKRAEIEFMDAFAGRASSEGIEAAWAPVLGDLAPIIGALVRDAIPRSNAASIAAAAAIGRDRSFRSIEELAVIEAPTLVFGGMDYRHPRRIAEEVAKVLPNGQLSPETITPEIANADDLARLLLPTIRHFLQDQQGRS